MLFNTFTFAVFFVIVYTLYLVLNHKWQNRMLLVASCIFYGAWDWRFLCLMFVSITTDYFCGMMIYDSNDEKKRKLFLRVNLFVNLFILGFFKYFNFFVTSFQDLLKVFGFKIHIPLLYIILPVGISFYTFQAMSYAIDIYRRRIKPTRNYLDYALFVTYFPQLVAGPIMRAETLLPQMLSERKFRLDWFYEGIYLILWGLYQKMFVADNLAKIADSAFGAPPPYSGVTVLLGLYAFAFQIYCDFAGYSNIARGLGKCMGFDVMINFHLPYFSTSPSEFWRRWHISLSSWLRDYLYIPLGGNRKGTFATYRNLAITMLLGGLWHGAAWNFVIWGAYQGILLIVHRLLEPVLKKISWPQRSLMDRVWFVVRIVFFFHLICLGWLAFRSRSFGQLLAMFQSLIFNFRISNPFETARTIQRLLAFLAVLVGLEIFQYAKNDPFIIFKAKWSVQMVFYFVLLYSLLLFGVTTGEQFIYFQF
ncbi:MAG: MBOAT family protein [Candidatus Omnitrophica bacterium]|nr:MBOAT family protein [Candidatus Omnitrophota bacterium]